jgi:hypothetical protein
MSAQAFDEIDVGEVAHIGIGIPAGIGSDVEEVDSINTRSIRRHQFPPRFFFTGHDVVAVQLQGDSRLLRPLSFVVPSITAKKDLAPLSESCIAHNV